VTSDERKTSCFNLSLITRHCFYMFDFSSIKWRATRYEGIFLHVLRKDEETGDHTVLIRMEPGCGYPAHRHNGMEEVLILQGGYSDQSGEHRAGQYVVNEAGSTHHPVALDIGEDCLMIAFAHGGIKLLNKD
jgi:anti-sigma factor ChrR (cupin superfamily)